MMFLYLILILFLLTARVLVGGRARRLETKYGRAATTARDLLNAPQYRQGNSNKPDPSAFARQQYLLGQALERRDRVESRYLAWQARADRIAGTIARLRNWKGRTFPYVSGVIDLATLVAMLCLLGLIEWPTVTETVVRIVEHWEK